MDNRRLFEFLHNCIVTASHNAYISHDHKTFGLLRNMDEVFMYFTKNSKAVMMYDELRMLEKYGSLQKIKYGGRFNLNLINDDSYKNVFIKHMCIIDFFNDILERSLDSYEGELDFTFEFEIPSKGFRVRLNLQNAEEVFTGSL